MFILLYVVMTMSSLCLSYFMVLQQRILYVYPTLYCYDNEFSMFILLHVVITMSSVCLSYFMLL